jgi:hypothetical protein
MTLGLPSRLTSQELLNSLTDLDTTLISLLGHRILRSSTFFQPMMSNQTRSSLKNHMLVNLKNGHSCSYSMNLLKCALKIVLCVAEGQYG